MPGKFDQQHLHLLDDVQPLRTSPPEIVTGTDFQRHPVPECRKVVFHPFPQEHWMLVALLIPENRTVSPQVERISRHPLVGPSTQNEKPCISIRILLKHHEDNAAIVGSIERTLLDT